MKGLATQKKNIVKLESWMKGLAHKKKHYETWVVNDGFSHTPKKKHCETWVMNEGFSPQTLWNSSREWRV